MRAASIDDYRAKARRRLPRMIFDYIDGGAFGEDTMARNVSDFAGVMLRQRVMRDVSAVDLSAQILGTSWAMPVGLAPVGFAGMYRRRGEAQAARAAATVGVPMCLSNASICSIEEVTAAAGQAPWFQLSAWTDDGYTRAVLANARAAGCPVLVFTADVPAVGIRYRDIRSGFFAQGREGWIARLCDGIPRPGWAWDVWLRGRPLTLGNLVHAVAEGARGDPRSVAAWTGTHLASLHDWRYLAWLRERWEGPLVVKGILDAEDARKAVSTGMDGIIVSNHGGRQMDGVNSAIMALPAVVAAAEGRVPVFLDGGVRTGVDVLRALALGAAGCFVGRPWAFALAASGEAGVRDVLEMLRRELEVAMRLTGCTETRSAGPHLLDPRGRQAGRA